MNMHLTTLSHIRDNQHESHPHTSTPPHLHATLQKSTLPYMSQREHVIPASTSTSFRFVEGHGISHMSGMLGAVTTSWLLIRMWDAGGCRGVWGW